MTYPSERLPRWVRHYQERDERNELSRNQKRTLAYYLQRYIATPKWADHRAITQIYKQATRTRKPHRDAITENPAHPANVTVDHIVPLNHPHVCGLHWEYNLEVIHHLENQKKGNHCWPDAWHEQCDLFEQGEG